MDLQDTLRSWLYSELKGFDTEAARRQALKQCARDVELGWRSMLMCSCGIGLATLWAIALWMLAQGRLASTLVNTGIPVWAGSAMAYGIYLLILVSSIASPLSQRHREIRRGLREMLADKGMSICQGCGYNLTGNVSGICPECGEKI